MAITKNTYTGNGSNKLFSITFEYIDQDSVKVYLNNILQTTPTQYTFANLTQIEFTIAPGSGSTVLIERVTESDTAEAVFFPGSPIRADDLNENQTQALYLAQETLNTVVDVLDTAEDAVDIAQGAVDAVSVAVPYIPVADLTALNALTPVNGSFYELQDSTGATTPTVTGIPVGIVGASGLTFRLQYNGTSFAFLNYFANDSETRYLKLSGGALTGDVSVAGDVFYVNTANDRVGINTNQPEATLDIVSQGTSNVRNALGRHYDNTTAFSQFKWIGGRARGNRGNPSAVLNNDSLVSFNAKGYKATGWSNTVGGLYVYAAENWTNTATGTYMTLRGVAPGGTTVSERVKFEHNLTTVTGALTTTGNISATGAISSTNSIQGILKPGTVSGPHPLSPAATTIDFTSIPSWVKRITIMFGGLSLSGTSSFLIQLGDSGGIENTGYVGGGARILASTIAAATFTAGFGFNNATAATLYSGTIIISNLTGNTWAASGSLGGSATEFMCITSGSKTLSDPLDRVRITSVNGTDTFDAGSVNILYEG
jgi:hypothetical protein